MKELLLIPHIQTRGGCWVFRIWPRPHLMLNEGGGPVNFTWCRDVFYIWLAYGKRRGIEISKCPGESWRVNRRTW